jgi:hypothetical protein
MEESGFYSVVGLVLALLFTAVMGACMLAVLYTDFAQSGGFVNPQEKTRLVIAAISGGGAALISWWMQRFAETRGFTTRFVYGVLIYLVVFCALGGLIELGYGAVTSQGPIDFSLSGIYFLSLGAFYTFAISLMGSSALAIAGLMVAAGLILALVGPRRIY